MRKMKEKDSNAQSPKKRKLEEHEPGADRSEVFQALSKVAAKKVVSKRRKSDEPSK